ncbi:MAG TPA: hypothetical protein VFL77_09135 [Solirubrobacterales bacterium]|nr:hypothetical protein [Solirubrobacterales bacterium]
MSVEKRRDRSKKPRDLRADTAERLEAIVEAAERAAEKVIDDAEAQARRYLAQARAEADRAPAARPGELSDLVDALLGQATSLRLEAERLQATLEDARSRLDPGSGPAQEQAGAPADRSREAQAPRLRAVAPGEGPEQSPAGGRGAAAGARLLATQLAVSGSSREEIEGRLRSRFEIEDTKAILDAILGPED